MTLETGLGLALAISALIAGGVMFLTLIAKHLLHVCPPSKILIFSGRSRALPDGRSVGFRVINGGRALRIPIVEKVDEMDVRLMSVPMTVQGAYAEGGIPLTVQAIANVKICTDPRMVGNAIERFLGHDSGEIARVAKETLEGHLRGVVSSMTPEEVNEDRLKFGSRLEEEAKADLEKLGLQLDTLKIQAVADDREYLSSIGRARIAEILKTAKVAESDAARMAEEAEAVAEAQGRVAQEKAKTAVAERTNHVNKLIADLNAEVKSEEERTEAAASAARALAEQDLQEVRGDLETLRLQADVTIPAEVDRRVKELAAQGKAASIEADGRAMSEALEMVAEAWHAADGNGMDIYVMQHLEEIFEDVANAAAEVHVKEASLIDSGDGSALPNYVASYPATMGALLREVSNTLGVNISQVLTADATPAKPGGNGESPAS